MSTSKKLVPVSCEIGDPRSPISYENRDPGPQINKILGTPGALSSYEIGDPLINMEIQYFTYYNKILGTPGALSLYEIGDPHHNISLIIKDDDEY